MKNFSFTSYLIPLMILFVLLKPNLIFSQGEANWWYFGQKAGLNFPFSAPTTVTNGVLWTYEGGASIADASGNLLFYTSGDTVYNKLHLIMANGTGLLGDKSSTQATMIIKRPGSSNIYYIFTNRAGGFPRELRYSIVDMNLAAGNGSVTVKNVLLHNSTSEKLNATLACNKKDVWIISHDLNGNGFRTFLLSASGISAPVLSAVGYSIPGSGWTNQAVGQLKVSPDGRKIAIGYFSARAEIYDFNRFTGVVSNPLTIVASPNFGYYGCEFSPDSKVLYYNGPWSNQITQIDLCAGSNAAILSSSVSLIASTGNQTGGFQLGPDGKIYIALNCFFAPKFLAVINNPNTLGLGCNFVNNAINLSGRNAGLSIPNFPSFYVTPTLTVTIPSFTSITSCATATFVSPVLSTCSNTNIITSYSWNFGDPGSGPLNTSSLANPVHNYATPGTYSVNLIVYSPCPDTLKQVITISSATVNATVQNANCISPTGSVIINSVTNGVPNYTLAEASTTLAVGFNTPYTLSNVSVGTHTYVLTSANGCNTTFTAQILPGGSQPNITATGPVTLNCVPNTTNIIAATTSTAALTYTWSGPGILSGANTLTATVNQAGIYTITAALGSCTNTATVSVISNTVTPNISISNQPTLTCINTSAVLQGTSTTSGATYNWLPQNVNTATVTVNTAGNYTLTVTNPTNGCKSTSVVAVVQNTTAPVITSVIANNSLNCITTNATLTATSAGNTIVWNGGSLSNAVNPAVVSVAGNYTVTATNPINSCTSSSVIAVVQNTTTPVITSAIASNSLTCINTNATLTATSAGNTIVWNGGSLTNAANPAVAIAAGNYTATATNPINGCTSTSVVAVVQNTTTPNVTASTSNHLNCNNTSAVLSATSTTGGLNYQWIAGPSLPNYTVNQAGTYTVTVTNPINGCSNTAIVSVTASPMFTTNITVLSQINCFGANNGALQVNVNGGSMPFTITNLNNNNTLTNINTFPLTLNNLSAGNYSIQVSDASGCQQVLYSSISQPSPLNVLVTGNSSLCAGSSASLSSNVSGGTAPYNFMWSPNGGTAPNTVVSPNVSTTYTLTVTDNNGCQAATNIAIAVNPSPGANVINNQLVGCAPVCASFSLAQNQNGNYNYNWVFTSSAPSPTVITSDKFDPQICFTKEGVYTANVIISTPIGCSTTITYTNLVTVYAKPTADFDYDPKNPDVLEHALVNFTNLSQGASNYQWYYVNTMFSTQENPNYIFQDPGKFLVTLIASNPKCSDTISKVITVLDDIFIYIPNTFTPNDDGTNDEFFPVLTGNFSPKNYSFEIFDRWGELLYRSNNPYETKWNGYYKNEICKDDVYVWKLNIQNLKGKKLDKTGHVTLMK